MRPFIEAALAAGATLALLLGAPAAGGAGDVLPPCEPVVAALDVDFTTLPPTVRPFVAVRPECVRG